MLILCSLIIITKFRILSAISLAFPLNTFESNFLYIFSIYSELVITIELPMLEIKNPSLLFFIPFINFGRLFLRNLLIILILLNNNDLSIGISSTFSIYIKPFYTSFLTFFAAVPFDGSVAKVLVVSSNWFDINLKLVNILWLRFSNKYLIFFIHIFNIQFNLQILNQFFKLRKNISKLLYININRYL
jgi:hypothetical protein